MSDDMNAEHTELHIALGAMRRLAESGLKPSEWAALANDRTAVDAVINSLRRHIQSTAIVHPIPASQFEAILRVAYDRISHEELTPFEEVFASHGEALSIWLTQQPNAVRNQKALVALYVEGKDKEDIAKMIGVSSQGVHRILSDPIGALAHQILRMLDNAQLAMVPKEILDLEIGELGLKWRTLNILWDAGIPTVREIVRYTREDLKALRNFGEVCERDLVAALDAHGVPIRAE